MKVNFLKTSSSARPELRQVIKALAKLFANEYDIVEKESIFYCLTDTKVKETFCEYLNNNDILHVTPYKILKDNGEVLADGFDIEEDELYTIAILKYS